MYAERKRGAGVAVRAGSPSTLPLLLFILIFFLSSRRTPLSERVEQATLPLEKLRVSENNNIYLT